MAVPHSVPCGYTRPTALICMRIFSELGYDDEPVKRVKQALDINHCSVTDTLIALAFTCDPHKKHDANTPPALHAFVPALKEAAFDDKQNEAVQWALIDTLPVHLSNEVRRFFHHDEEVGNRYAAQRKLAEWLDDNTRPAELIESLLGLPDSDKRVQNALEYVWLDASHESIAEFRDVLESARSELKNADQTKDAAYEDLQSEFTLLSMNRAIRSQLACLAGLGPQFDELACANPDNDLQKKAAMDLIDLHCVAGTVMQPLSKMSHEKKIAAMRSIIEGKADKNDPLTRQDYEKAKTQYLGRNPGKESESTVKFERAFLYRLAGTLSAGSQEAAHKIIRQTVPPEVMKTELFTYLDAYTGFMTRLTCSLDRY